MRQRRVRKRGLKEAGDECQNTDECIVCEARIQVVQTLYCRFLEAASFRTYPDSGETAFKVADRE